jgi:hypothetical protein
LHEAAIAVGFVPRTVEPAMSSKPNVKGKLTLPKTPLAALLRERMAALGLDATAIGRRLGYIDAVKAAGRVQALGDGLLVSAESRRALTKLAAALEVDEARVTAAVDETRARQQAAAETEAAACRALKAAAAEAYVCDFKPHAMLVTEFTRPSSITMCIMSGGAGRWLRLNFDATQPPETFFAQSLAMIGRNARQTPEGEWTTLWFGRVLGIAIHLAPDESRYYDVNGQPYSSRPNVVASGRGSASVVGAGTLTLDLMKTGEPTT